MSARPVSEPIPGYNRTLDGEYWRRQAEEARTIADSVASQWPDLADLMRERATFDEEWANQVDRMRESLAKLPKERVMRIK
jgi:hypothetical protein